jgi:hypothetical protein
MFFWLLALRVAVEQVLDAVQQPPGPGAVDHVFHLLRLAMNSLSRSVRLGVVQSPAM